MLVSESLIFVHNPRTGGSSVREYLKKALPDKYYPAADTSMGEKEKVWVTHQGIGIAYQYASRLGFDPFKIPTIVCIRNPYSLTLSGYQYLSQRWGNKIGDLEGTFSKYLSNLFLKTPREKLEGMANSPHGPFSGFLLIGDRVPPNLTVARTESLSKDVTNFLGKLTGPRPAFDFPHINRSKHEHFSSYYTGKEEEIVYRMYKNTFDNGLYKRYEGLDQDRL